MLESSLFTRSALREGGAHLISLVALLPRPSVESDTHPHQLSRLGEVCCAHRESNQRALCSDASSVTTWFPHRYMMNSLRTSCSDQVKVIKSCWHLLWYRDWLLEHRSRLLGMIVFSVITGGWVNFESNNIVGDENEGLLPARCFVSNALIWHVKLCSCQEPNYQAVSL